MSEKKKDLLNSLNDVLHDFEKLLGPLLEQEDVKVVSVDSFTFDLCKQIISEVRNKNQGASYLFLSMDAYPKGNNDHYRISLSFLNAKKEILQDFEKHEFVYVYEAKKIENSVVRILKGEDSVMISL